MEIVFAADHRGLAMKEALKAALAADGYALRDVGAHSLDLDDDYVDFSAAASAEVAQNSAVRRGIFICGSGIGMDMAANKHRGVRAALVADLATAVQSREHGDANVLVLAADALDTDRALEIARVWLQTPFSAEERHARRLKKIAEIEERNFR